MTANWCRHIAVAILLISVVVDVTEPPHHNVVTAILVGIAAFFVGMWWSETGA